MSDVLRLSCDNTMPMGGAPETESCDRTINESEPLLPNLVRRDLKTVTQRVDIDVTVQADASDSEVESEGTELGETLVTGQESDSTAPAKQESESPPNSLLSHLSAWLRHNALTSNLILTFLMALLGNTLT